MTLSDRIRECAAIAGNGDELARRSGIPRRTLENYLTGKSEPKASALAAIADAAHVDLNWLIKGEDRPGLPPMSQTQQLVDADPHLVMVPRYDVRLSAGDGAFIDRAKVLESMPFPASLFTRHLRRSAASMIIVEAAGDSMKPTIADGDLVMIDTADIAISAGIWAFALDDIALVKRLNRTHEGVEIISDNPAYPPQSISRATAVTLNPIGRVVWTGHAL